VEGRGSNAFDTQRTQSSAELTGGLVGERHRHDLLRLEGSGRDLPRDSARNRGRLSRPGTGEDAHGPTGRLHGGTLFGVQAFEDPLGVQGADGNEATGRRPLRRDQSFVPRFRQARREA
jgi:hypothetical protein